MIFSSTLLQTAKSKYIPKRVRKFSKPCHKKKWMTDNLLARASYQKEWNVR